LPKDRKIDEIIEKLDQGDWLVVAEISRLGRNMLQTLGIINTLTEKGVKIIFVRQPELSTNSPQAPLLLAIYSYFAQAEKEYISIRTKQGLKALKDRGIKLGRPKGSRNKKDSILEPYKEQILEYKKMGLPLASILKIIHNQMEYKVSYNGLKRYLLAVEL
jgi:DNA invertase Pin-like site-specific DNA recombinase